MTTDTKATPMDDCGCTDFTTSRRRFLAGVGGAVGAGLMTSIIGDVHSQVAFGATAANPNVLVVLSLRGGADGLSMVVPHGDADYARARPSIAVPTGSLLGRDSMFGLHPEFAPLLPMWVAGRFGAVHAVGLPQPNRSHFLAMEQVEDADPGSAERRGWINRLIGLESGSSPGQAVQLGDPMIPTALYGPSPVLGLRELSDIRLAGSYDTTVGDRVRRSLHRTWDKAPGPLGQGVRSAVRTAETMSRLGTSQTIPLNGARYPGNSDLSVALSQTATLIRSGVGTQIVTLDYGNWDMHTQLGQVDTGRMQNMVAELSAALAAFYVDLGAAGSTVTVVTISEFGRRVAENGNRGLDHGYGNCMFLLGAGVKGGRVHGSWPGLGSGSLIDGDLLVTTDYRSVLAEVLGSRFPEIDRSQVFPGFRPETLGAMS